MALSLFFVDLNQSENNQDNYKLFFKQNQNCINTYHSSMQQLPVIHKVIVAITLTVSAEEIFISHQIQQHFAKLQPNVLKLMVFNPTNY